MAQKTKRINSPRSERVDPPAPLSPERKARAFRALERLAVLREGLPPVDAVEVIRSVRDEPAGHETD